MKSKRNFEGNMLKAYALLLTIALLTPSAQAGELNGKVVGVSDGDTLTVLVDRHEVKVRLGGIDAPEKRQPFGQVAKKQLSDCAFGKTVTVEWAKLDRYGRTIGKVVTDGVDCGLSQINAGLTWHYKAYAKEQSADDRLAYAAAEARARAERKGLWSDETPTAPWDFRHR